MRLVTCNTGTANRGAANPAPVIGEIIHGDLPWVTAQRAAQLRGQVLQVSRDGQRACIAPRLLPGYRTVSDCVVEQIGAGGEAA